MTVPGEGVADGVDLVVADAATGEEIAREGLPIAGFATVGVDIVGDFVLVNRLAAAPSGEPTEPTFPMVLDLASGELTEIPFAGVASLARTVPGSPAPYADQSGRPGYLVYHRPPDREEAGDGFPGPRDGEVVSAGDRVIGQGDVEHVPLLER